MIHGCTLVNQLMDDELTQKINIIKGWYPRPLLLRAGILYFSGGSMREVEIDQNEEFDKDF